MPEAEGGGGEEAGEGGEAVLYPGGVDGGEDEAVGVEGEGLFVGEDGGVAVGEVGEGGGGVGDGEDFAAGEATGTPGGVEILAVVGDDDAAEAVLGGPVGDGAGLGVEFEDGFDREGARVLGAVGRDATGDDGRRLRRWRAGGVRWPWWREMAM